MPTWGAILAEVQQSAAARGPLGPDLDGIRPLRAPGTALMKAIWRGEAAVTPEIVDRLRGWASMPVLS